MPLTAKQVQNNATDTVISALEAAGHKVWREGAFGNDCVEKDNYPRADRIAVTLANGHDFQITIEFQDPR